MEERINVYAGNYNDKMYDFYVISKKHMSLMSI